jgi:hypothetical protein
MNHWLHHWRQHWHRFRDDPPGLRFERHFERAHHQRMRVEGFGRVFRGAFGVLVLMLGLIMLITPGPGVVACALGATLLAQESLALARWMDRCELAGWRLAGRWRRR